MVEEKNMLVGQYGEAGKCIVQELKFGWHVKHAAPAQDAWSNEISEKGVRLTFARETDFEDYQTLCQLEAQYQASSEYLNYETNLMKCRSRSRVDEFASRASRGAIILYLLGIVSAVVIRPFSIIAMLLVIAVGLLIALKRWKEYREEKKKHFEFFEQFPVRGRIALSEEEVADILAQAHAILQKRRNRT